jgi:hypothetical protein
MFLGLNLEWENKVHHHKDSNGYVYFVICDSHKYHMLLHLRTKALKECGHANWRKCVYCKEYSDPKQNDMTITKRNNVYHKHCAAKYSRRNKRYHRKEK